MPGSDVVGRPGVLRCDSPEHVTLGSQPTISTRKSAHGCCHLRSPDPDGSHLTAPESRRNVVTRGIDLNALVGREFTIGSVRAFGQRLCEPCVHLQRLTRPGVIAGLVHQGGLRADILTEGEIRLEDPIAAAFASTS